MMVKKALILGILLLTGAVISACVEREPIKIGLSVTLSGRFAEEGAEARNAALMAVEEINLTGGIHGKKIQLLIRDDQNDYNTALRVDEELINLKVRVIVGHTTSNMTSAVLPLMNKKKMLLLSPTSVSDEFTGIDDFFIRMQPSHKKVIEVLADEIYTKRGIKKLAMVKETINKNYTDNWLEIFKAKYLSLGGEIIAISNLVSGETKSYSKTAQNLLNHSFNGVVIIANPLDAALFTIALRKIKHGLPVFVSGWGMTGTFLTSAKEYGEGVVFSYNSNPECHKDRFKTFKLNFEEKFGYRPSFFARNTYDSFTVLFETLKNNKADTPVELKKAILKQRVFSGIVCDFEIDEYGDRIADPSLFEVKKGNFQRIN